MGSAQWGKPVITVEKVLDSNPNIHLMNLEDALRKKRFDEAVMHLEYAWEVGREDEKVKQQCLEILKLLKQLGYAKEIQWDKEQKIVKILTDIFMVIFAIIIFKWFLKIKIIILKIYVGILLITIFGMVIKDIFNIKK